MALHYSRRWMMMPRRTSIILLVNPSGCYGYAVFSRPGRSIQSTRRTVHGPRKNNFECFRSAGYVVEIVPDARETFRRSKAVTAYSNTRSQRSMRLKDNPRRRTDPQRLHIETWDLDLPSGRETIHGWKRGTYHQLRTRAYIGRYVVVELLRVGQP